jgi:hypothetical protein
MMNYLAQQNEIIKQINTDLLLFRQMIDFYSEVGDKCLTHLSSKNLFYHPDIGYTMGWTNYQNILYRMMLDFIK